MAKSATTAASFGSLEDLVPRLQSQPGFRELLDGLDRGERAAVDGAWGSASALISATIAQHAAASASKIGGATGRVVLIVLPRISDVDDFAVDFAAFSGVKPAIFPAWESLPRGGTAKDPILAGRTRVVRELLLGRDTRVASTAPAPAPPAAEPPLSRMRRLATAKSKPEVVATPAPVEVRPPTVIVTSIAALLHPVPTQADIASVTRRLHVGQTIEPDELVRWLSEQGCVRVPAIELPGEFTLHGGILDIFSPSEPEPLRIEFFGDEIESIRRFEVATQKKTEDLKEVFLTLVGGEADAEEELAEGATALAESLAGKTGGQNLFEALPSSAVVLLAELPDLVDEAKRYLDRLDNPRGFYSLPATLKHVDRFPGMTLSAIGAGDASCRLSIESIERFHVAHTELAGELEQVAKRGEQVLIACHNAAEKGRLTELLAGTDLLATARVVLCEGSLLRGFRLVRDKLSVLSDNELFGRREIRRVTERKTKLEGRAIDSFLELNPGDLVVHVAKGIARYHGMKILDKQAADGSNQQEEHLALEFRDNVMVYVPVSLIHLVQKYIGGAKSAPQLSKAGSGGSWERKKQQVADSVRDLAAGMLQMQAARNGSPGFPFPPDSKWQDEFDAAFPYQATVDQLSAVASLKDDMMRPRPMDRLICGDVGYGKTEVAMRAAFKAVDAGKQVAVLVPTTVLAEQHFRTFSERMAEFPFRIEVLSRFRSKRETAQVLEGLANGSVDLVIGTHRIVQPDIRFHDLGLLIIDEEQRFGVDAKEQLKKLRLEVDVLTLSATPIPRTLHMSLVGVRDISNLMTPPHDRIPVETRISRFDRELIRSGIVRELNRGGQVYFVHNRVYDIESIAEKINAIVPEARIGIGHGQMGGDELEEVMVQFVNHQLDVLVATTIIESGLDIPNANTMFIDQADKYGLADLHQLRGRVGRYKHRAYCYLLLDEGQSLSGTAAKRLKAIEEFSELGSGFKIAMRDLEIRGAGNILGTEQSGHIASVGYEMYCQLLEDAGRSLRNLPVRELAHVAIELPITAHFPDEYIPPGRLKIEMYRRLSRVDLLEVLAEYRDELRDRFGPIPDVVDNLFKLKQLQILARAWQIDDIHLEEDFAVLGYRSAPKIRELVKRAGSRLRIVDGRSAYLVLQKPLPSTESILRTLEALLRNSGTSP
jgi:transcription-repair coupling factor (superfamily II helicase)